MEAWRYVEEAAHVGRPFDQEAAALRSLQMHHLAVRVAEVLQTALVDQAVKERWAELSEVEAWTFAVAGVVVAAFRAVVEVDRLNAAVAVGVACRAVAEVDRIHAVVAAVAAFHAAAVVGAAFRIVAVEVLRWVAAVRPCHP